VAKTKDRVSLSAMIDMAPRVKAALKRPGVIYMGPCVVQAPGAWTRVGPTWLVPNVGWITVGPGARQWGTTQGLAELASEDTAKPTWHSLGISIVPDPHLVFAMQEGGLKSSYMSDVRQLSEEVDVVSALTL